MSALFVTNFNPHFTGVSATAANVLRAQVGRYDLSLVGQPLPDCPAPISRAAARRASASPPPGRPFALWHVRRNPEMRVALWLRDVRRLPIRIVFTSAAQRRHSAYPRWLISRMDAVIATTEEAARFVPHVRAVVPHGVDCARFAPAPDRAAAWAALGYGGRRGVATVGRIRPEKGTDLFVETMLRVLPEEPDLVALVVGRAGGKHEAFLSDLKARVAAAGLCERLLFVGERPPEALPALMRALSLVVQLPRYEGYGMVPLEGLASGVPFVGSETGYYRAFSAQGTLGQVVPLEEVAAAEAAVREMLGRSEAVAPRARAVALESYSAAREADGIDAVYEALWSGA
jgi:mannosyltransferase